MADRSGESVDWGRLTSARGSAEEVGELIGLIESGEDVWGDLIGEVLHQVSLYDATAPAVSWAVGFLRRGDLTQPSVPARRSAGRKPALSQKTWAFIFLSGAAAAATQTVRSNPQLASHVLDALREGTALYEKTLADPEVVVRLASAAILKAVATSRTDRALAFGWISECYERETESEARVAMLSALDALAEPGKQWPDRLLSILNSTTSDRERFYASAYLARRLGHATPEGVADRIAQSYASLSDADYVVELTNLEEPDELIWISVRAMDPSSGVACLAKTLKLCRDGYAFKTLSIVEWLLRLASNDQRNGWGGTSSSRGPKIEYFGVKPSRGRAWLRSPEAKLALAAIANKAEVWRIETNLFSLFGLPGNRKELRELLRTPSAD
jgi:hypothetical protein